MEAYSFTQFFKPIEPPLLAILLTVWPLATCGESRGRMTPWDHVYDVQLSCTLFVCLKYSVFCPENVLARSAVVFVTSVLEVHDVIALYKFCISLFILLPFPLDILAVQLTYGRQLLSANNDNVDVWRRLSPSKKLKGLNSNWYRQYPLTAKVWAINIIHWQKDHVLSCNDVQPYKALFGVL